MIMAHERQGSRMQFAWLERYRRAWIDREAEVAAGLFTGDAVMTEGRHERPDGWGR